MMTLAVFKRMRQLAKAQTAEDVRDLAIACKMPESQFCAAAGVVQSKAATITKAARDGPRPQWLIMSRSPSPGSLICSSWMSESQCNLG